MLERALAAHLPFAWVTGDSVYGADPPCAAGSRSKGLRAGVTSAQRLGLAASRTVAEDARPGWTPERRRRSQGPSPVRLGLSPFRRRSAGWQKALLIRRALEKPDELSFYLTLAPEGTELATLVQVAGTRWTIEACFEAAKGEVGLDEYEVRSWTGWHRHVTLAMLAHAYLAVVRQHAIGGGGPRPRGRLAAPHGSRGAPADLASRLGQAARPHPRARLVGLATTTPAARQTITLAAPDLINPGCSTRRAMPGKMMQRSSGRPRGLRQQAWASPSGVGRVTTLSYSTGHQRPLASISSRPLCAFSR